MFNFPRPPICTVVIPAFNEELMIGTTLKALLLDAHPGEFDIIVVCNGCSDQTAKKAHASAPSATVIDLQLPSKAMALNTGIATAKCSPIVFLDADIKTCAAAIRTLVTALLDNRIDLSYGNATLHAAQSSKNVQAFYRAWMRNRYFDHHKVGGLFAVSQTGLRRLGLFPDILNDDEFVRRKLIGRSVWMEQATYTVEAPRTIGDLIKVRSRVYRGNSQLEQGEQALGLTQKLQNVRTFLGRLFLRPWLWYGAGVFLCVSVAAHLRNRLSFHSRTVWEQDKSARSQCIEA